jgi:hypothetical protein
MGKRSDINSGAFGIVAFFLFGGMLLVYVFPALGYAGAIIAALLMVFFIFSRIIR